MKKMETITRLAWLRERLLHVWRLTRSTVRRSAAVSVVWSEQGFSSVFVAVMIGSFMMLLAYFLNIGGLLIARARLQTIVEFSAAGGGRVVAEEIAKRASENIKNGVFIRLPGEENANPKTFLTSKDRLDLQSDPNLKLNVENSAKFYADKNNVFNWTDLQHNLTVDYGTNINNCDGVKTGEVGRENTVEVVVTAYREEPLFLERVAVLAHGSPTILLSASSFYSIPICL